MASAVLFFSLHFAYSLDPEQYDWHLSEGMHWICVPPQISYRLAIIISYIYLAFTSYKLLSHMRFHVILLTLKGSDFSSRSQSGFGDIPGKVWGCCERRDCHFVLQLGDCLARFLYYPVSSATSSRFIEKWQGGGREGLRGKEVQDSLSASINQVPGTFAAWWAKRHQLPKNTVGCL